MRQLYCKSQGCLKGIYLMKTDVFSDFFIGRVKIFCGDDDTSPFLTKENADLADVLPFIRNKELENAKDCSDL